MLTNQKQVCILLVEDDPGDRKLIKTAIVGQDCEIKLVMAPTGEDAMDYLQMSKANPEQCPRPSIILLDLNMPGMNGKEFLRRIKADDDLCVIPVIVVTTSDSESDIQDCYELHAAGYIQKTGAIAEFGEILKKLTRYWFSASAMVKS